MPLQCRLFRADQRLQAALTQDTAHVTTGARGEHVRLIQRALVYLGFKGVSGPEYSKAIYGPTTAKTVLNYKNARRIINFSYQQTADDIVGKMTVAALDAEMVRVEFLPAR